MDKSAISSTTGQARKKQLNDRSGQIFVWVVRGYRSESPRTEEPEFKNRNVSVTESAVLLSLLAQLDAD